MSMTQAPTASNETAMPTDSDGFNKANSEVQPAEYRFMPAPKKLPTSRVNLESYKLGKRAPRHDPRTLELATYLTAALPPAPQEKSWAGKVAIWPMMGNDTIGDCTCAAAGHMIEAWTAYASEQTKILSDQAIVDAYSAITGYDPTTGNNDNGAIELDVLNYWRKTGIGGDSIYAFVALEPGNHEHIRQALALFGGCYIGLQLPVSAQTQKVWSVPPGGAVGPGAPGSWGGHAVPVVAYDLTGLTIVTWGGTKRMTWSFWDAYCDEAYAILTQDWIDAAIGKAPSGFDLPTLQSDLAAVTK